jgi:hypothetical protein
MSRARLTANPERGGSEPMNTGPLHSAAVIAVAVLAWPTEKPAPLIPCAWLATKVVVGSS